MLRRQKLVVGNWKMFGSLAQNAGLLDAVLLGLPPAPVETAFCVPFPYLAQMKERCSGSALAWGAQDLSDREPGAYTGDVAAGMLADFGCRFVIVGHSERRAVHGESSELVARKAIR